MTTLTLIHRLADADRALLARFVAALERFVDPDAPGLAPVGPLFLVPTDSPVEISMASGIPIGFDGIQTFRPASYDGAISAEVTAGPGGVTLEGDSTFRIALTDGAAEGDTITVKYRADERHGSGEKWTEDDVTYTVVAADAQPLTEAGFDVVEKGQPAPAA